MLRITMRMMRVISQMVVYDRQIWRICQGVTIRYIRYIFDALVQLIPGMFKIRIIRTIRGGEIINEKWKKRGMRN